MLNPVCPESGRQLGRWTETQPAAVGPMTVQAGTTAPRPAPGTLGAAGETGNAEQGLTCRTRALLVPGTRNKPVSIKRVS